MLLRCQCGLATVLAAAETPDSLPLLRQSFDPDNFMNWCSALQLILN